MTASTGTAPSARATMRPASATDSATDMPTFFSEYPSEAETVTDRPSTAADRARSAPRTLGTRAQ